MCSCQGLDAGMIPPKPEVCPKLDPRLSGLVSVYETGGVTAAMNAAKIQDIQIADGMVRVIIEARLGGKDSVIYAVSNAGGRVETSYENLVQALIPLKQLKYLAGSEAVNLIRLPVRSHPGSSAISE